MWRNEPTHTQSEEDAKKEVCIQYQVETGKYQRSPTKREKKRKQAHTHTEHLSNNPVDVHTY